MQQTHNTSIVTKRLNNTLRCDRGENLYQQVIERNFQIIGDLLKKLDKVFTKQEEYEFERMNYAKRIVKIEADIEAIHNEYRRESLQIFSCMNDFKLELNGIDKQLRIMYESNRKGIFKSFKIIDNLELHSQKCVSNCQDLFPRTQKQEKSNKYELIQEASSFRQKIIPKQIIPATPDSRIEDQAALIERQKSTEFKIENYEKKKKNYPRRNIKSSFRSSAENKVQIKKQNSYSSKQFQNPNYVGVKQKATLEKLQEVEKKSKEDKCERQSPRLIRDSQLQEIQATKKEEERKFEFNTTMKLIDFVYNNTTTSPERKQRNPLVINDVDTLDIQQTLKEAIKKNTQNSCKIQQLEVKINQVTMKSHNEAKSLEVFKEEIFSLKRQIKRLRQTDFKNFVTKKEITQKLCQYSSGKGNEQNIFSSSQQVQFTDSILTKCLACNQATDSNNSSAKVSYLGSPADGRSKKLSVTELKKRTKEVLRQQKSKSKLF